MATKQQEKKPLHLAKMNIKKGDTVLVLTGKDKGKQGVVSRALPQVNKVVVEGLNMVKKHVKSQGQTQTRQGGVIDKAMPLQVSNTMLICSECGKPTRVAHERRTINDKERSVRVCKKCHKVIEDRSRKD
jgi:large subunit ribosomal protein L24